MSRWGFYFVLPFILLSVVGRAETPDSILELVSDTHRPALQETLTELRRVEKELSNRSEKIRGENPSANTLLQNLGNPNLPAPDREALKTRLTSLVPELKRFQDDYDTLSNARYDFFLQMQVSLAEEIVAAGDGLVPPKELEGFRKDLGEIKASWASYQERRGLFGQGKDTLRLTSIREVFDKSKKLVTAFGARVDWHPAGGQAKAPNLNRMKQLLNTVRIVPAAVPLLWDLYRAPAQRPFAHGKAPLSDHMLGLFKRQGDVGGFKVEVVGKENLTKPQGPKDVVIYCPQHSNAFLDFVSASNLDLKGAALFGAADNFHMGKWAADRFETSDSFVMVGRGGGKPLAKTKELIASGKINKFILFPEGSLSGGLGETRPVRPGFMTGFIEQLQNEGYNVTLVPISFPNSMRFDQTVEDPRFAPNGVHNLKAVVHSPLTTGSMSAIHDATGQASDAVYLLRQLYLEEGATPGQPPGLPPIDSLLTQLLERWGLDAGCIERFAGLRGRKTPGNDGPK